MDYQRMMAHCGRDCFNCLIYPANDNARLRPIIAKRVKLPEEQIRLLKGNFYFI
jgi:hypothetical protein